MDVAREEVCDAREFGCRVGGHDPPLAANVLERQVGGGLVHLEVPDAGVFRVPDFLLGIVRTLEGPDHVRLSGADPDLAEVDVLNPDFVVPLDFEHVRAARLRGFQVRFPRADVRGGELNPLTAEGDGNLLVRV